MDSASRTRAPAERTDTLIRLEGLDVRFALEGPADAPVVTFAHQLAGNLSIWNVQAAGLAGEYRVLRFDARGHGGTDAPPGPYTLEQLALDLAGLLAALEVRHTHLVGLSLGGMVGQTLALSRPDLVLSLTLCDAPSRTPAGTRSVWEERARTAEERGMEPLVQPTLERWFTPAFRLCQPEVVGDVAAAIRSTPPAGYAATCRAIARLDLTDRLREIAIPTLIVVGEDDPAVPVAAAREVHERVPGSQLTILPATRHLALLEQARLFDRTLKSFLARVG